MNISIAQPDIGKKEISAVINVLKSKQLAQGKTVEEFEKKFAQYIDTKYAIATSNGTTALHLSLLALGIKSGDEVITTSFSFVASANAILYVGAKPVFVDIDPQTFNIDPKLIEKKITNKTKAIIPVHLYGLAADITQINNIAKKYHLKVIEDACQAHGAAVGNKKVGTWGELGCFSFYPTKNMTTGEGGIITTSNKNLARKLRLLRNQGMEKRYHHEVLGYNFRMTNIAAAIGIEQLKRLDQFNKKRKENARMYEKLLKNTKGIILPHVPDKFAHVFHQYTIRVTKDFGITRDRLALELEKRGIGTGIYYPIPIHRQKVYKTMVSAQLPYTERVSKEALSLPIHPFITKADIRRVASAIVRLQD